MKASKEQNDELTKDINKKKTLRTSSWYVTHIIQSINRDKFCPTIIYFPFAACTNLKFWPVYRCL